MADAFTPNYNWTLPETGASVDTWGTKVNANFSNLDGLLFGKAAKGDNRDITSVGILNGDVSAGRIVSRANLLANNGRSVFGDDGTNIIINGPGPLYAPQGRLWGSNDFDYQQNIVTRFVNLETRVSNLETSRISSDNSITYAVFRNYGSGDTATPLLGGPNNNTAVMRVDTAHAYRMRWDGNNVRLVVDNADLAIPSSNPSDARLKNVKGKLTAAEAGSFIDNLNPIAFEFRTDLNMIGLPQGKRRGFIAQELEKLDGSLIQKVDDTYFLSNDTAVQLASILVREVQSLRSRVSILEAAIKVTTTVRA